jgi:pimeloyl-ACP methyl ester carboxylesterase
MKRVPVLILHGWNLSSANYFPLKKELGKSGYKVYCVDLPGFGSNSRLDRPYTIYDYCQFVVDYIRKCKITQVVIIGHSFGGRIGIQLSITHPDLVKALILTGTPALGKDLTAKEKVYLVLAKIGDFIFSLPLLSRFDDLARRILYKLAGSYDYYKTKGVLRETFKNIVSYRLEPLLKRIRLPTLLIWGEDDRIVPLKVAIGMKKLIINSNIFIIPGARHAVPWSHAKVFGDKVSVFIDNI